MRLTINAFDICIAMNVTAIPLAFRPAPTVNPFSLDVKCICNSYHRVELSAIFKNQCLQSI